MKDKMKVILATRNEHKVEEINPILSEFGMKAVSLNDLSLCDVEVIEDGETFEANAYKKAFEIMKKTGQITIADDSGLEVAYLNDAPGVYSARFAGENATDEENNEKLIKLMKGVPAEKRGAKYVSVITMVYPEGKKLVARGEISGRIAMEKEGNQGFGYDPYFIPDGYDRTFGTFSLEEKNKISHRGNALIELRKMLENM